MELCYVMKYEYMFFVSKFKKYKTCFTILITNFNKIRYTVIYFTVLIIHNFFKKLVLYWGIAS